MLARCVEQIYYKLSMTNNNPDKFPNIGADEVGPRFEALVGSIDTPTTELLGNIEKTSEGILNCIAELSIPNTTEEVAGKLKVKIAEVSTEHVKNFLRYYDELSKTQDQEEIAATLASLLIEDETNRFDFIERLAQECSSCNNLRQDLDQLRDSILDSLTTTYDIEEDTQIDVPAEDKRNNLAYNIGTSLEADLSHIFTHLPEEYTGKARKEILHMLGKHSLDIAKIGAGVGLGTSVALWVSEKF